MNGIRTRAATLWTEGERAVAGSREHHRVRPRHFDGDLGARVTCTDDQHVSFLELPRILVRGHVKLDDPRIELGRVIGNPRPLPARHRDHHVVGFEPSIPRGRDEAISFAGQPLHSDSGLHPKVELPSVRLEVVGHLVLAWEPQWYPGKGIPGRWLKRLGVNSRSESHRLRHASRCARWRR